MQTWLLPARHRRIVYVTLGLLMFGLILLSIPFKKRFNFIVSDGRGYYVYLPSIVIDGDLDFENQIVEHWDVDAQPWRLAQRTPTGLVRNVYPIGMGVSLAPTFLLVHGASLVLHTLTGWSFLAPDGYSSLYQLGTVLTILAYAVGSMCLIDHLLVRKLGFDPAATVAAVVLFWLGSPFLYYTGREPCMVHVVSGFWVNLSIVLLYALYERVLDGRPIGGFSLLLPLAAATSMALLCRPTNACLMPFFLYVLYTIVRNGRLLGFLAALPIGLLGLAPIGAQMLVWYILDGRPISYSYGDCGFFWTHPMAWQTLLSSRHGLFFWSPLLGVAFVGLLGRLVRRPHPFIVCGLLSFVILWYCNASWCIWWFGDSFGGRAYLELSVLFVLGLAFLFERWQQVWPSYRLAGCLGLGGCLVYQSVLMVLYILSAISRDEYLISGW
jgi:hypothetical protein